MKKSLKRELVRKKDPRKKSKSYVKEFKLLKTKEDFKTFINNYSTPLNKFKKGFVVKVNDTMQTDYSYVLEKNINEDFIEKFKPELTPPEMLKLGIFEGKYLNDCVSEFPKEWFLESIDKLSFKKPDITLNQFKIKSRQSLKIWKEKGWLNKVKGQNIDCRGWFQWYCRYYLGRRIPNVDIVQVNRWNSFKRHRGAIVKNCDKNDCTCRPKQRQAILQWAYDPFI